MSALLTVKDLTVAFRQDGQLSEAVRGVSFTVDRGETVALVGEKRVGKIRHSAEFCVVVGLKRGDRRVDHL